MTQRYREEADTLLRCRTCHSQLIGQAETLRQILRRDDNWMLQNKAMIRGGLHLRRTLETRQLLLD